MDDLDPALFFASAGFVGGLVLFVRGLVAYRRDRLISSVATSSLDAIAAGEVRISGIVEAIDGALVSPLQSRPCVWYRARVEEAGDDGRVLLDEERSREFRVRTETGSIRVLPRGARWEVGPRFEASSGLTGDEPAGLLIRGGSAETTLIGRDPEQMSEAERAAAVEALLTVHVPAMGRADGWDVVGIGMGGGLGSLGGRSRRYREARLEPGDRVTILGQALPWADVREAMFAAEDGSNVEAGIAADIAAARAQGALAASPEEAWGNAAIPGFGIGQPTLRPDLDPAARQPEPTGLEMLAEARARHDIPADELVLSRGPSGVLAVYEGDSQAAVAEHDLAFVLGLCGAVMSVLCALALGALLSGTL